MQNVLIAAVLKPANDVRMYHKIGKTIAKVGFQVHILGYETSFLSQEAVADGVHLYPHFNFRRLAFRRLWAGYKFWQLASALRPSLLVISAVELLPWAMFYCLLFRVRIVYDVRENYYSNVLHQNHYPFALRLPIALGVRLLEWLSRFWVTEYWLAERAYADECGFVSKRYRVIENKALAIGFQKPLKQRLKPNFEAALVGNFSETYGTMQALRWFVPYLEQGARLRLVGKASDSGYKKQITAFCATYPDQIRLEINEKPQPWKHILEAMQKSDVLLLPYTPNKSTENCIPTKMFEALSMHLPMIVPHNPLWKKLLKPHEAAYFINFEEIIYEKQITQTFFYTEAPPPLLYAWDCESTRIKDFLIKKL